MLCQRCGITDALTNKDGSPIATCGPCLTATLDEFIAEDLASEDPSPEALAWIGALRELQRVVHEGRIARATQVLKEYREAMTRVFPPEGLIA